MKRFSAENLTLPKHVTIVEVGPRDGLQNEHAVSTDNKVALINALSQTGLTRIEVGAFVSAKRVPQMADSLAVFEQIHRSLGVQYSALTPNLQGFQAAVSAKWITSPSSPLAVKDLANTIFIAPLPKA